MLGSKVGFESLKKVVQEVGKEIGKGVSELSKEVGKNCKEGLSDTFKEGLEKTAKEIGVDKIELSNEVKSFKENLDKFENFIDTLKERLDAVLPEDIISKMDDLKDFINEMSDYIDKVEQNFDGDYSREFNTDYLLTNEFKEVAKHYLDKLDEFLDKIPDSFEPDELSDEEMEALESE